MSRSPKSKMATSAEAIHNFLIIQLTNLYNTFFPANLMRNPIITLFLRYKDNLTEKN